MIPRRGIVLTVWLAALAASVPGCGPRAGGTPLVPTLPGDGDEHTAKPVAPRGETGNKSSDPWAGRTDLLPPPAVVPPSPVQLPPVTRYRLPNGLQVIVAEDHDLPIVEIELAIKVGREDAPRDKTGIAELAAALLIKGSKGLDDAAITEAIDVVGGTLSANASYEASLVRCSVLARDLGTCLKLVPAAVAAPTFPEDEMRSMVGQLGMGVLQQREDPARLATAHFQNLLWGDKHPRGWVASQQSLSNIQRKDVQEWHRTWFRPNNAVLSVAGDVDAKKLRAALTRAFRGWRKGNVPKREVFEEPSLHGVEVRLVDEPELAQAQIRVGHLGIAHRSEDFFDTLVVNQVLGGGIASRLARAVGTGTEAGRSASSSFDRNLDRGAFMARATARTKDTVTVLRQVVQEIQRMAATGPTDAERVDAISSIAGQYVAGFESITTLANSLLAADLHGLGEAYVRDFPLKLGNVSKESARLAASKHFDAGNLAVVVVGDAKEIAPQLKALGLNFDKVGYREAIAAYERAPEPEDPAAADAEGRRILEKALAAKGGAARLAAVKSMLLVGNAKARVKQPGGGAEQKLEAKVRRLYVAPNRMRRDTELEGGKAVTVIVLDGNSAWASQVQGGQTQTTELPPQFVEALREELWRDQEFILLRYKEKGTQVAALPEKEIDGAPHYAVRVTRVDGNVSVTLYLDKKTLLLRRMTYSAEGNMATEDFRDYRTVDGIKVAHERRIADAASSFEVKVEKAQFNLNVDEKVFAKPSK